MKAYPKPEKEVICYVCQKPIESRDDLILIEESHSKSKYELEHLHIDCFGEVFRKKPHIKPYKKPSPGEDIIHAILFGGAGIFCFLFANESSAPQFILLIGAFFLVGMISRFYHAVNHKAIVEYITKKLEEPLPATCGRCETYIPPGKIHCPSCRKKYDRTIRQKMKKLKN